MRSASRCSISQQQAIEALGKECKTPLECLAPAATWKSLGSGASGSAYSVPNRQDAKKAYVVKVMHKWRTTEGKREAQDAAFWNEADTLKLLKPLCKSPEATVPCFVTAFCSDDRLYLVTEFLPNVVELFDFIAESLVDRLSPTQLAQLVDQLVTQVRRLQQYGIAHRDLKPENVLINRDTRETRIIDLGTACVGTPTCSLSHFSSFYLAPEMRTG
jgi:serine/threonine protein kinase